MIVLDTHIWIWWVHNDPQLPLAYKRFILSEQSSGLGVSAISIWEIAMLVSRGRLVLPIACLDWLHRALGARGIRRLDLSPEIATDSVNLPGSFHRDPADRILVATARVI
ncbi:MAG: type II toxin-antitoxin system VapC family toxin [Pirellulaceae bacterium]